MAYQEPKLSALFTWLGVRKKSNNDAKNWTCLPCGVDVIGTDENDGWDKHAETQAHKSAAEAFLRVQQAKGLWGCRVQCQACGVVVNNEADWECHVQNDAHKEKVSGAATSAVHTRQPTTSVYTCELCKLRISGWENYQDHLEGRRHKEKQQCRKL